MNKQLLTVLIIGIVVGALAMTGMTRLLGTTDESGESGGEKQPLYWVAPMDPSYRRDGPGKSPMGMDLVPVYEEDGAGAGDSSIRISPAVVNNLGVRTAEARRGQLNTEIRTVGYVKYDEDRLVHVHPRVSGWIEKLHVKTSGDPVTGGEPLYELYSPELVNAQEELLLALSRGNERLLAAAEERLLALQFSAAQIETLKRSRKVSQVVKFTAPQSGVVDHLQIREGFYVQPGNTLMSIAKLDEVWVEAEVFERQAALVSRDAGVTMSLDYFPGRQWQGKVDYIYPTLDPETRTVRLRLRFSNVDAVLKPNMFALITITSTTTAEALLIPAEALIRTGRQDRVVLALGKGRFKAVEVKTGRSTAETVEIIEGLQAGDEVVISAQFLLDSESSKTSDFRRFSGSEEHSHHSSQSHSPEPELPTARVQGVINAVDPATRSVNISREAIPKWNRGPATMDFSVSPDVDIQKLNVGETIEFTFVIDNGEFIVSALHAEEMTESHDMHQHHEGHGS